MAAWATFIDLVTPLEGLVEIVYRHIGLEDIKYNMKAIDILARQKLATGLEIICLRAKRFLKRSKFRRC
jgi:hypothetical protein